MRKNRSTGQESSGTDVESFTKPIEHEDLVLLGYATKIQDERTKERIDWIDAFGRAYAESLSSILRETDTDQTSDTSSTVITDGGVPSAGYVYAPDNDELRVLHGEFVDVLMRDRVDNMLFVSAEENQRWIDAEHLVQELPDETEEQPIRADGGHEIPQFLERGNRDKMGDWDYYECPKCGDSICSFCDCPNCGWYNEDAWETAIRNAADDQNDVYTGDLLEGEDNSQICTDGGQVRERYRVHSDRPFAAITYGPSADEKAEYALLVTTEVSGQLELLFDEETMYELWTEVHTTPCPEPLIEDSKGQLIQQMLHLADGASEERIEDAIRVLGGERDE